MSPLQLAHLPLMSQMMAPTPAVPVCMTLLIQAAMQNGQTISVIMAVIDDVVETPETPQTPSHGIPAAFVQQDAPARYVERNEDRDAEHHVSGRAAPPEARRGHRGGKGHRRKDFNQRDLVASARSAPCAAHVAPRCVTLVFTEAGAQSARVTLRAQTNLAVEYATAVKGRLGQLLNSSAGAKFLAELVGVLPFGRGVRPESDVGILFQELVEALPRLAMQPLGRLAYVALLARCNQEPGPSCQLSRCLADRLAQLVLPLGLCPYGQKVLQEAMQLSCMKPRLEEALARRVNEISSSSQGCDFLSRLLAAGCQEVAMALLESDSTLRSLSFDKQGTELLLEAANFGPSHRAQLAATMGRAGGALDLPEALKKAACWK